MDSSDSTDRPGHRTDLDLRVNVDDLWPPFGRTPPRTGKVPRHHRGPRGSALSRDEIVRTAIAIADSEGAAAVNMRRIARELHVGAMSLYWHVADKDHLLDLMLDAIEGEEQAAVPLSDDWRDYATRLARQSRSTLLRHPWVIDFIGGRPPVGPNALYGIERSLAALDGLGLETRATLNIMMAVDTYVMGAVLRELRETRTEREQRETGLPEDEIEAETTAWRERLARTGDFEHIVRILGDGIDPGAPETRDERFEFGLACLLDGIGARLPALADAADGGARTGFRAARDQRE